LAPGRLFQISINRATGQSEATLARIKFMAKEELRNNMDNC